MVLMVLRVLRVLGFLGFMDLGFFSVFRLLEGCLGRFKVSLYACGLYKRI